MSVLEVRHVKKAYEGHVAVNDVSFQVPEATIFGLLGPNGAGKTTVIRMITGITKPDAGEIFLKGEAISGVLHTDIGYLPEERGLYRKMSVAEQLVYLARLKGLARQEAVLRTRMWLERFDMMEWRKRKIDELSKGMQQKIQFIATVIHEPSLLILDEPFTGLDPVNTNLIKDEIRKMRDNGRSIIFSTHRMEQVEEICEEIVLINSGRNILSGKVHQVKNDHKQNVYQVRFDEPTEAFEAASFEVIQDHGTEWLIQLKNGTRPNLALQELMGHGLGIHHFEELLPTLNDIFIKTVAP